MHLNTKKLSIFLIILLAAVLLPGWMLMQNMTVIPSGTATVSGEASVLKSRTADWQLSKNKQDPSQALIPENTTESSLVQTDIGTFAATDPQAFFLQAEAMAAGHLKKETTVPFLTSETTAATSTATPPATTATTAAATTTTIAPTTTKATAPAKTTTAAPTTTAATTTTKAAPTTTKAATTTTKAATTTTRPTTTAPTTTAAPTTTKATTTPTMDAATVSHWRSEILRLTNEERAKASLPPLAAASSALNNAVAIRAYEITIKFSHDRPNLPTDKDDFYTVLGQCGVSWRTTGENIACCTAGSLTPTGVMNLWMNSPGHRANIMRGELNDGKPPYTAMGVGYFRANGKDYFVQLFIG